MTGAALVLLALHGAASAQPLPPGPLAAPSADLRPRVGARIGASRATLANGDRGELDGRTGYVIGGFAIVPLGVHVELDLGLEYSQRGATIEDPVGGPFTLALDYLAFPLLVAGVVPVSRTIRVRALAGASINVNIRARAIGSFGMTDFDDSVRGVDEGVVGGFGVTVDTSRARIVVDARFELGVADIDERGDGSVEHRLALVTAGVAF